MKERVRQADERSGGLDADLFVLARSYLAFWAASSNFPEPDDQRVLQIREEMREKGVEIIDTYGRKSAMEDGTEHLVSLPSGSVRISWEPPKLWHEHQPTLREDNDRLMEDFGIIFFAYEPLQNSVSMYDDLQIERVSRINYRPLGFPRWTQFSIPERWFGPRGNVKYAAQQLRTLFGTDEGWVLRRISLLDGQEIEAFLMNNGEWLECDVAPLGTERREYPLYLYPFHSIDGENPAQTGVEVLSEDNARRRTNELNGGWIRDPWKRITAISILISIASLAVGIAALVK